MSLTVTAPVMNFLFLTMRQFELQGQIILKRRLVILPNGLLNASGYQISEFPIWKTGTRQPNWFPAIGYSII